MLTRGELLTAKSKCERFASSHITVPVIDSHIEALDRIAELEGNLDDKIDLMAGKEIDHNVELLKENARLKAEVAAEPGLIEVNESLRDQLAEKDAEIERLKAEVESLTKDPEPELSRIKALLKRSADRGNRLTALIGGKETEIAMLRQSKCDGCQMDEENASLRAQLAEKDAEIERLQTEIIHKNREDYGHHFTEKEWCPVCSVHHVPTGYTCHNALIVEQKKNADLSKRLEEEKNVRNKYQDIVYAICNLYDKEHANFTSVTVDVLVEEMSNLFSLRRKRLEECEEGKVEEQAYSWPEQNAVDEWLKKYDVGSDLSFPAIMELKTAVSKTRIDLQRKLEAAEIRINNLLMNTSGVTPNKDIPADLERLEKLYHEGWARVEEAEDDQKGMSALRQVCVVQGSVPLEDQSNSAEDIALWADSLISFLMRGKEKAEKERDEALQALPVLKKGEVGILALKDRIAKLEDDHSKALRLIGKLEAVVVFARHKKSCFAVSTILSKCTCGYDEAREGLDLG